VQIKSGKQDNCKLEDDEIDALCKYFKLVCVLWDGVFSLAWKKNPTTDNSQQFQQFVKANVIGHVNLGLSITPKLHLMFKHVRWHMDNIKGGLGNKMEDWIKKLHQVGKQLQA
jgi:hypothetical protein